MKNRLIQFAQMILVIVSSIIILSACIFDSSMNQRIQWLNYPDSITEGQAFQIKGEYLTIQSGEESVKVVLTVRELESNKALYTSEVVIPNYTQSFSFSNIILDKITCNVYFEMKLIQNGNLLQIIDTRSTPILASSWHTNIITTYFNPTTVGGAPAHGTWGNDLTKENPYYFALPYRDFYYYVWNTATGKAELTKKDYYGISNVKNRWIQIFNVQTGKTCYAQWEDVGPWNYYDPYYVFGSDLDRPYAEIGIDMGWSTKGYRETNKAGLDISPEAMKYLNNGVLGKITVNWRFVSFDEISAGPWLNQVSEQEADIKVLNLETETLRTLAD